VGVGVLGVVDEILKLQDIRERGEPTPYSTGGGNKQTVDQGFADKQEARDLPFEDDEDHGQVRRMRNEYSTTCIYFINEPVSEPMKT
jgi:hypothetical protein